MIPHGLKIILSPQCTDHGPNGRQIVRREPMSISHFRTAQIPISFIIIYWFLISLGYTVVKGLDPASHGPGHVFSPYLCVDNGFLLSRILYLGHLFLMTNPSQLLTDRFTEQSTVETISRWPSEIICTLVSWVEKDSRTGNTNTT